MSPAPSPPSAGPAQVPVAPPVVGPVQAAPGPAQAAPAPGQAPAAEQATPAPIRRSTRQASLAATARINNISQTGRGRRIKEGWQVEAIIDRRFGGRATQYLVQWQGHPATQNTWEPRGSLDKYGVALVRQFDKQWNAQKKAEKAAKKAAKKTAKK